MEERNKDDVMSIQDLLAEWNVPVEIQTHFLVNNIQTHHLKDLNDGLLQELCPSMGLRIDLKNKIAQYLTSQARTETVSEASIVTITDGNTNAGNHSLLDITNNVSFDITDFFPGRRFPDFDLKTLLSVSPCGASILKYYETNNNLDSKRKNRLTDIIIRHLFTFIVNNRITFEEYNIISAKIVTLFPSESPGTYFTRPVKKADSVKGKPVYAKGKLVDKVRNLLYSSGERKRKKSCEDNSEQHFDAAKKNNKLDDLKEEFKEEIAWLNINSGPWDVAIQKWNQTFQLREKTTYLNIYDYIENWKIIRDIRSDILINLDFDRLYPDRSLNFVLHWNTFFNKFLALKKQELNDDYKQALVSSLEGIEDENLKIPMQIVLFAHLLPPKGRYSKKAKYSTIEALEGMFLLVEDAGDIEKLIKEQQDKASIKKQQVQPYIILHGALQGPHIKFYIIVDEIRYSFETATKAFDVLFKLYHVLHAKYPNASDHLYLVIQRCIYKIETKYDNVVPYILDVLKIEV